MTISPVSILNVPQLTMWKVVTGAIADTVVLSSLTSVEPSTYQSTLGSGDPMYSTTIVKLFPALTLTSYEGSVTVVGLRSSWSFRHISLIPSNEGFIQWSRIRLANGVDSHDPHQVFFSMHKTSYSAFDFCSNLCLNPRATAEICLLHQVVRDGGATVVGRGTPGKLTAGCCVKVEVASNQWTGKCSCKMFCELILCFLQQ